MLPTRSISTPRRTRLRLSDHPCAYPAIRRVRAAGRRLAFVYQDEKVRGEGSTFFKLVSC